MGRVTKNLHLYTQGDREGYLKSCLCFVQGQNGEFVAKTHFLQKQGFPVLGVQNTLHPFFSLFPGGPSSVGDTREGAAHPPFSSPGHTALLGWAVNGMRLIPRGPPLISVA